MKVPARIPEWLALLPKDALLDSGDIARIFGYKNSISAASSIRVNNHKFPEPDFKGRLLVKKLKTRLENKAGYTRSLRWKAMTIRNYIRQYNRGELK